MEHKIKIPDESFIGQKIKGAYEKYLGESNKKPTEVSSEKVKPVSLEDEMDFYTIEGVKYRNGIYAVDLLKTLLDNGCQKTQDEWSDYSRKAQEQNQFYVGDFPLYHSLFTSLFRDRDGPNKKTIEEIRGFLKDSFFDHWLMTLTRIKYTPSGKDTIIHNYGLKDQYEIQENIVGREIELVKDTSNPKVYQAILSSDNRAEIQNIYKWITGKSTYLWRVNQKPENIDERVAWFYAFSVGAYLSCGRDPRSSNSALGVRRAKKIGA